uniref:Uncharacterized protein n=1 Tax=Amphimedon queenslandica TaxID=400682 RepID=A0A1X7TJU8_AMPQE
MSLSTGSSFTTPTGGKASKARCTAAVRVRAMSEYYKKLDAVAQKRYLEKLQLLDLGIEDDPYSLALDANFIDDMTKLPEKEYGHIFCYFIERPGVYTKKESRYVQECRSFRLGVIYHGRGPDS